MRKNPKLNGLVCAAYGIAWRSIDPSERRHAPKLFELVERLVDAGHVDVEFVAARAIGMLGQPIPQAAPQTEWQPGLPATA